MVVFLQQEGEVIGDVGQEVVVRPEGAVQFEPQQLGADGGDQVVGEGEAGDLQVVLSHQVQHVVTLLKEFIFIVTIHLNLY